jgi:RecB family exonuclease
MKITFGLSLDGYKPSTPCLDHLYCGPAGLVKALEQRLGLVQPDINPAIRLESYLLVAEHYAASQPTFYSRSLKADRWSTARALLGLRDDLRLAGWDGCADSTAPARLSALAELEAMVRPILQPGLADRMHDVLSVIRATPVTGIEIVSHDPLDHAPILLRRILEILGAKCLPDAHPSATEGNIRLVQNLLSGLDVDSAQISYDDDSVLLVTAHSELTLAHAAARLIKKTGGATLVATRHAGLVKDILTTLQCPAPAADSASPLRPILQLLPLSLSILWSPIDPSALMAFLTHPCCPVHYRLRRNLAKAVREYPGTGSQAWLEAIADAHADVEKEAGLPDETKKQTHARIDRDLNDWIEPSRFARDQPVAGIRISPTVSRLSTWAAQRAATSEDPAESRQFSHLSSTAHDLAGLLERVGKLRADELEILLEEAMGTGAYGIGSPAQLGCSALFTAPGALIETADTVIWWGFEDPQVRTQKTWNREELEYLESRGVVPQPAAALLDRQKRDAIRPIMAAGKRLVLMWPAQRAGDPIPQHPLLSLICSKCKTIPILNLNDAALPAEWGNDMQPQGQVALPPKKRWVKLADGLLLEDRSVESYSSLVKFIKQPFEWVFQYPAQLRKADLMDFRIVAQRGNLIHEVVELLAAPDASIDWKSVSQEKFNDWLRATWQLLLDRQGANLLMPGAISEGRRLLLEAERAIWQLIHHLRMAQIHEITAEQHMKELDVGDLRISGYIDLWMKDSAGRLAVLDLKYGGKGTREKELKKNTALQLAVYSVLLKTQENATNWPHMAYYILRSSDLLAQNREFFGEARTIACDHAQPGPETTWSEFLQIRHWRRQQLDLGWIEFPLHATEAEIDNPRASIPPAPCEGWEADPEETQYHDFQYLTGWEVQS